MEKNNSIPLFNVLRAEKVLAEFSSKNIEGYYCPTREDAVKKVMEILPAGSVVSSGGSATLHELDLHCLLKQAGMNYLDPDDVQGAAAKAEMAHRAISADYYLMSANAISMSGEIVNLDGIGNRVAALGFGPKNVVLIAGMNKVTPDLESAIKRAKEYAAPLTLLLFKKDYASYDELMTAAEHSYSHLLVTSMSVFKGRIKVVLVGEDLGF